MRYESSVLASAFAAADSEDAHLGFLETPSASFIVRARSPFKGEVDQSDMRELSQWSEFANSLGQITAANHARGDDDYDSRLVANSFEDAFARLVPITEREPWTEALIPHAWEQLERRGMDYGCWLKEHHKSDEVPEGEAETTTSTPPAARQLLPRRLFSTAARLTDAAPSHTASRCADDQTTTFTAHRPKSQLFQRI